MPDHASWGRRLAALTVDWLASVVLVILAIGPNGYLDDPASGFYVLGVFLVQATVLTRVVGGSLGQLVLGVQVLRTGGRPLDLPRALFRTALICVVIPPLVFEPSTGRGLHDIWTDSATYLRVPPPS